MVSNDTFYETVIGREVMELEGTAHWRTEKAEQYSDDRRNTEAAKMLTELAEQLRKLAGSPKAVAFEKLHDFIFSDDDPDADDPDNGLEVVRLWSEYRSRVGFNNFPEDAETYLDDLMELAREAS